jgi:hypothetical protein
MFAKEHATWRHGALQGPRDAIPGQAKENEPSISSVCGVSSKVLTGTPAWHRFHTGNRQSEVGTIGEDQLISDSTTGKFNR